MLYQTTICLENISTETTPTTPKPPLIQTPPLTGENVLTTILTQT